MSIKIIYFYDALCGWCYGFSPVMKRLWENYQDEFKFEVMSSGMIMGDRVGPIGEVAPYIKEAYKTVENRSGVSFGKAFIEGVLEEGTQVFSSELPARAMILFKEQKPKQAIAFAHHLQDALYYHGMDLNKKETYIQLFNDFELKGEALVKRIDSVEIIAAANAEFVEVSRFGVSGFPTVIAKVNGQYYALSRGYVDYQQLEAAAKRLLQLANQPS
jgi:putative protein-disulfide isomerase